MNKDLRKEIKEVIKEILADFDVNTLQDFMDDDPDSGLYETLKAGVLEEYGLSDEEMGGLLDEVLMNDQEILDEYYELTEQSGTEEGLKFLDEYIKKAGDDVSAQVLSQAGEDVLMYTNELEKGIEYFRRAIEKEPENPDIYWSYFTNLDEITDEYPETIDDAVLCLTKIIEICSKIVDTEDNENRYEYIDEDFDKELDIAQRYMDLAVIYMKIPDYKKAEECIDKTLKVFPDDNFANSIKAKIVEAIDGGAGNK